LSVPAVRGVSFSSLVNLPSVNCRSMVFRVERGMEGREVKQLTVGQGSGSLGACGCCLQPKCNAGMGAVKKSYRHYSTLVSQLALARGINNTIPADCNEYFFFSDLFLLLPFSVARSLRPEVK